MPNICHDLAMLRIQNADISKMSNEQLYYEYKRALKELMEAKEKYSKEHSEKPQWS